MRLPWRFWMCIGALLLIVESSYTSEGPQEHDSGNDDVQEPSGDGDENGNVELGYDESQDQQEPPEGDDGSGDEMFDPSRMDPDSEDVDEPSKTYDELEEDLLTNPAQIEGLHGKIDKNGDGKISMPEVMEFSAETSRTIAKQNAEDAMEDIDMDKDGKVSREEFHDWSMSKSQVPLPEKEDASEEDVEDGWKAKDRQASEQNDSDHLIALFKIADRDGDGSLDADELPTALYPEHNEDASALVAAASMKAKDKDGNGELSQDEVWQAHPADEDAFGEDSPEKKAALFHNLDKDRSGGLNLEELKSWESEAFHVGVAFVHLFKVADQDNDQHISLEELHKAKEHLAESTGASRDARMHLVEWAQHHEL